MDEVPLTLCLKSAEDCVFPLLTALYRSSQWLLVWSSLNIQSLHRLSMIVFSLLYCMFWVLTSWMLHVELCPSPASVNGPG